VHKNWVCFSTPNARDELLLDHEFGVDPRIESAKRGRVAASSIHTPRLVRGSLPVTHLFLIAWYTVYEVSLRRKV
jgi:hypothetical protein